MWQKTQSGSNWWEDLSWHAGQHWSSSWPSDSQSWWKSDDWWSAQESDLTREATDDATPWQALETTAASRALSPSRPGDAAAGGDGDRVSTAMPGLLRSFSDTGASSSGSAAATAPVLSMRRRSANDGEDFVHSDSVFQGLLQEMIRLIHRLATEHKKSIALAADVRQGDAQRHGALSSLHAKIVESSRVHSPSTTDCGSQQHSKAGDGVSAPSSGQSSCEIQAASSAFLRDTSYESSNKSAIQANIKEHGNESLESCVGGHSPYSNDAFGSSSFGDISPVQVRKVNSTHSVRSLQSIPSFGWDSYVEPISPQPNSFRMISDGICSVAHDNSNSSSIAANAGSVVSEWSTPLSIPALASLKETEEEFTSAAPGGVAVSTQTSHTSHFVQKASGRSGTPSVSKRSSVNSMRAKGGVSISKRSSVSSMFKPFGGGSKRSSVSSMSNNNLHILSPVLDIDDQSSEERPMKSRPPPTPGNTPKANNGAERGTFNIPAGMNRICACESDGLESKNSIGSIRKETSDNLEESKRYEEYKLHPLWSKDVKMPQLRQTMTKGRLTAGSETSGGEEDAQFDSEGSDDEEQVVRQSVNFIPFANQIGFVHTVAPGSKIRTAMDFIGYALILHDAVVCPFHYAYQQSSALSDTPIPVVPLFWLFDFICSALTGYVSADGRVHMRLSAVLKHYAQTWLLFDLFLVSIDWAIVLNDEIHANESLRRRLKLLTVIRILRFFWPRRKNQVPEFARAFFEYHYSVEVVRLLLGIVRMVCLLLWMSHVVASIWYDLGRQHVGSSKRNWMEKLKMTTERHRYAVAYHWAFCQFFGNTEIDAQNYSERIMAISVLIVGFITSVVVVGSITSSMTRVEIVLAQEAHRLAALKRYLLDNQISTKTSLRVQRSAKNAFDQQLKHCREEDVQMLSLVSEPLRIELHYEINNRVLGVHPFMKVVGVVNPEMMKRICHTAVSRVGLSAGDVLFHLGEIPSVPMMFFVISGRLKYTRGQDKQHSYLFPGHFACEAVLWTPWMYCGSVVAKSDSILLEVSAKTFVRIATQHLHIVEYARQYGQAFVDYLNQAQVEDLTDLDDPEMEIGWLAKSLAPRLEGPGDRGSMRGSRRAGSRSTLLKESASVIFGGSDKLGALQHFTKLGRKVKLGTGKSFESQRSTMTLASQMRQQGSLLSTQTPLPTSPSGVIPMSTCSSSATAHTATSASTMGRNIFIDTPTGTSQSMSRAIS